MRKLGALRQTIRSLPRGIRIASFLVGAMLLLLLPQAAMTITDGLRDELGHDVIVIFGNKVELDGSPSPRLLARLERGLELFHQQLAPRILVSGGLGKEGFDEASVMRDWLVQNNVPTTAVLLDHNGNDSRQTAEATARLLREMHGHSVLVVTQYWHITRAKVAMKKAGVDLVYSAHAFYFGLRDV